MPKAPFCPLTNSVVFPRGPQPVLASHSSYLNSPLLTEAEILQKEVISRLPPRDDEIKARREGRRAVAFPPPRDLRFPAPLYFQDKEYSFWRTVKRHLISVGLWMLNHHREQFIRDDRTRLTLDEIKMLASPRVRAIQAKPAPFDPTAGSYSVVDVLMACQTRQWSVSHQALSDRLWEYVMTVGAQWVVGDGYQWTPNGNERRVRIAWDRVEALADEAAYLSLWFWDEDFTANRSKWGKKGGQKSKRGATISIHDLTPRASRSKSQWMHDEAERLQVSERTVYRVVARAMDQGPTDR